MYAYLDQQCYIQVANNATYTLARLKSLPTDGVKLQPIASDQTSQWLGN